MVGKIGKKIVHTSADANFSLAPRFSIIPQKVVDERGDLRKKLRGILFHVIRRRRLRLLSLVELILFWFPGSFFFLFLIKFFSHSHSPLEHISILHHCTKTPLSVMRIHQFIDLLHFGIRSEFLSSFSHSALLTEPLID